MFGWRQEAVALVVIGAGGSVLRSGGSARGSGGSVLGSGGIVQGSGGIVLGSGGSVSGSGGIVLHRPTTGPKRSGGRSVGRFIMRAAGRP